MVVAVAAEHMAGGRYGFPTREVELDGGVAAAAAAAAAVVVVAVAVLLSVVEVVSEAHELHVVVVVVVVVVVDVAAVDAAVDAAVVDVAAVAVVAEYVNFVESCVAVVEFEYMAMAEGEGLQALMQYVFDVGDVGDVVDAVIVLAAAAVSACSYTMKPSSEQNGSVGDYERRHVVPAGTTAEKMVVNKPIEVEVN